MRYLTVGITFLLLFFILIPTGHAQNKTYEVGASSLNVRSAPSYDADIIGQLGKGDKVVVFQETFGWVQTYYDGQVAWVASQFLFPAGHVSTSDDSRSSEETVTANGETITVTASEVRIRTGPGIAYSISGHTSNGNTYNLIKTTNKWNKVVLNDGSTGWIAAWLTDTSSTEQAADSNHDPNNQKDNQAHTGNSAANSSLEGYNIVLDPGHGGKDPGAIGIGGVYEKNVIMNTVNNVAQKLRDAGATVVLTRDSDYFVTLENRVELSGNYNTHAFISLHYNAYPIMAISGISTHFYAGENNRALAREIQSALRRNVSLQSRGIMQSNYHVLRENSDPAVLVELGFITNPYDLTTAQTAAYQNNVANGIVEGLMNYFRR